MKKSTLDVLVIQSDLVWENPEMSRAHINQHFQTVSESPDVVVLPEMFTSGFSMDWSRRAEEHAQEMPTLQWMRQWANRWNALVMGSVAVRDQGKSSNRLYAVKPNGEFQIYDKRHTFRFAGEHQHFEPGNQQTRIEWQGWRIAPFICYDLRFPVWSRNHVANGQFDFDVMIYVANWPAVRSAPWQKLLLARAIENQSYVVACNRVGIDGAGLDYAGDSAIIDFKGDYLFQDERGKECLLRAQLSMESLTQFRDKFPAWMDADSFEASWKVE